MTGLLSSMLSSIEVGLIFSILAMGYMLTYKYLKYYDLSLEGTYPLGAFLAAVLIQQGLNPYLGILGAIICGGLAGLLTYFFYKKIKVDPLLSGILTLTMLYSINLKIGGASNITLAGREDIFFNLPKWSFLLIIAILVKIAIDYYLKSEVGYLLKITGNNRKLVKQLGKNPDTYIMVGLVLSNALIALSGGLMANYQGFADIQMGTAMIVTGLASIIIGDTIMKSSDKLKDTSRAILGALIYRLISGLAIYLGLNPNDLKLVTALIVIGFIAYNNYLGSRNYKRMVKNVGN
ncbi:ABC transporter permease [Anaerococcus prevotii]|uniref:Branched-chain amino acid ABC transporter, permease protein n=1 Tax=Anaerococcus prevotii ACS-065-V-Col13 TaxID=879305 RepID=F0GVZ6_9FIRM|nr:ABC transporter [Anaerococcus prevotii]EGC81975.1 branched-chain amino acid ABC transporter, permease protein [Anaerococcus prevotii ACS-065-V-Col13]